MRPGAGTHQVAGLARRGVLGAVFLIDGRHEGRIPEVNYAAGQDELESVRRRFWQISPAL